MQVVVEYKRPSRLRPSKKRPPKPKVIEAQHHQDKARADRTTVRKAKWLVDRYGLVELAMEHANKRMKSFPHDGTSDTRAFWRSVYEYLRKHEDRIRRAPMEFSWPAAGGRRVFV